MKNPQKALPRWQRCYVIQRALSRLLGTLARCEYFGSLKNFILKKYIGHYGVNMQEAKPSEYQAYPSFNKFFTRPLKQGVRPIDYGERNILCPADGSLSEFGHVEQGQLLQAKGHYYALQALLAGDQSLADLLRVGSYFTVYLSPKDYHRVHMPMAGQLQQMIYVPGVLFPVHTQSVNQIENLFARNERVICLFNTKYGPMAVILVGALIVGSMATTWHGVVKSKWRKPVRWNYSQSPIALKQGAELGHFELGSTVIVLTSSRIKWTEEIANGQLVKMGRALALF